MKEINTEWMNMLLNDRNQKQAYQNDLPKLDWVSNNKGFKHNIKFKVLPANSKENKIFSWIVGTHWNLGPENKRFVCPEQTPHLHKLGITCPICEAKRKLLAEGFTQEELSKQGKFGLIPVFDPVITSSVKVVMVESDMNQNWDKAHVSILQQKGTFLTRWLVEKYADSETPDFLQWEDSNLIKFTRETDNGTWQREISFAKYQEPANIIAKLQEENEAIVMPDLWKAPTDKEILEIRAVASNMIDEYRSAKNVLAGNASALTDDDIPF